MDKDYQEIPVCSYHISIVLLVCVQTYVKDQWIAKIEDKEKKQ